MQIRAAAARPLHTNTNGVCSNYRLAAGRVANCSEIAAKKVGVEGRHVTYCSMLLLDNALIYQQHKY